MIKYCLLILTLFTLWSCGSGENSSPPPITEPIVVNPPREVGITVSDKFVVNEKSTSKIDVSLSGTLLASDKFLLAVNSQLVAAQLNSDRNIITIDVSDVNQDTDVKIKMTIEGPSNTPSKEITVSITNVSANLLIQELNNTIEKITQEYKYNEELHVANMLSLLSPINKSDLEKYNPIFDTFLANLEIAQKSVNDQLNLYRDTIKKYQEKSIDETALRSIYVVNEVSKAKYNLEKITALNKLLVSLSIPIEFPQNTDENQSNFWGNKKIGSYIGGTFFFNSNYYYLNSILDKACFGS